MPGPMAGVKVVDLTSMLSGPWATTIMADQGADVIKVEPPAKGDHVRSLGNQRGGMSSMFLNINRNKRSITVNLKAPDGVGIVHDLVRNADVMIQNFRPGVVERLGVGYDAICKINPDIIYMSLSGFGETGPWKDKPVYDPVIQAVSGLTTVQAGSDAERPRLVRTVLPDKFSAMAACQAMTAALFHKARTGQGQHVRLSMLDAVLSFLWASDFGAQTYPDGAVSNQTAASFIDLIYETADGYMTVSTMSDKEWRGFCAAMKRSELAEDPRFATPVLRDRNVDERLRVIQDCLKAQTTAENLAVLEAHGVPCAPALTRAEVVSHPQVVNNEILFETDHPAAGRLRQARNAACFAASPAEHRMGAPELGEHTTEILEELGRSAAEIASLQDAGVIGAERDKRRQPAAAD
ncbi:CaiB/BaiF CoA transferase family protein [Pelagibius sp.]|uniref:CaiB/BaiF CoA transferase family protein n=1 Tax=Pelagibius sp. TaxID=1931238 RepID=UPI003BAEA89C